MINAAHFLLFSDNAEADRLFFRDVLEWPFVDAGHGWLIFRLPAAETAIHPSAMDARTIPPGHRMLGASLYLMCEDLQAEIRALNAKKVECTEIAEENWGFRASIRLPSGGEIGLYQPKHPTAYDLR
ncbi:MAG TPA: extradiol dioxygenase [Candidatus Angelobacter sp.]|nr:extradiol dioxygenase [Candidatus Angelobacter sp.]